jgi:hypothetical protein
MESTSIQSVNYASVNYASVNYASVTGCAILILFVIIMLGVIFYCLQSSDDEVHVKDEFVTEPSQPEYNEKFVVIETASVTDENGLSTVLHDRVIITDSGIIRILDKNDEIIRATNDGKAINAKKVGEGVVSNNEGEKVIAPIIRLSVSELTVSQQNLLDKANKPVYWISKEYPEVVFKFDIISKEYANLELIRNDVNDTILTKYTVSDTPKGRSPTITFTPIIAHQFHSWKLTDGSNIHKNAISAGSQALEKYNHIRNDKLSAVLIKDKGSDKFIADFSFSATSEYGGSFHSTDLIQATSPEDQSEKSNIVGNVRKNMAKSGWGVPSANGNRECLLPSLNEVKVMSPSIMSAREYNTY